MTSNVFQISILFFFSEANNTQNGRQATEWPGCRPWFGRFQHINLILQINKVFVHQLIAESNQCSYVTNSVQVAFLKNLIIA